MNKKLTAAAALLLILALITPFSASAAGDEAPALAHSQCALVYSLDNDMVLWTKGADEKIYPASAVKLMTAAIAIEHFGSNTGISITAEAEHLRGVSGNNIAISAGERFTAEQLLYALIVSGANDAANVIACTAGQSMAGFITLMNEKAAELEMNDTVFTNPTGMHDPNMKTTVGDLIKLAAYVYRLNLFTEIAGVDRYIMPATNMSGQRILLNKNHLVSKYVTTRYYMSEVNGMNAGSTTEAGYCVTASAVHDGLTYIAVVTGADRDEETIYSFVEAAELLEWAFDAFAYARVLEASKIICEVPVELSSGVDHVTLLPERGLELFLPSGIDVASDISYEWELVSDTLTAPVAEGQRAGTLRVLFRGNEVAELALITKNSIAKSRALELFTNIRNAVLTTRFVTIAVIAVIAGIIYVFAVSVIRYRRRHRRRYLR